MTHRLGASMKHIFQMTHSIRRSEVWLRRNRLPKFSYIFMPKPEMNCQICQINCNNNKYRIWSELTQWLLLHCFWDYELDRFLKQIQTLRIMFCTAATAVSKNLTLPSTSSHKLAQSDTNLCKVAQTRGKLHKFPQSRTNSCKLAHA